MSSKRAFAAVGAAMVGIFGCDSDSSSSGGAPTPDGGVVVDGAAPGTPPTPPGSPGTACGLKLGTSFKYVVGLSQIIKVHLDGEVDEFVASLKRDGNNQPFYPGGIAIQGSKVLIVGGASDAGTPNPGIWEGPWPAVGGIIDAASLAVTGGAGEGPLRLTGGLTVMRSAFTALYSVDRTALTSTEIASFQLPANYRITEILDAKSDAATVLASIAPIVGVNNRAFTASLTSPGVWTTTEVSGSSLPVDAPIIAARALADGRALWFDSRGFYIDGKRIRDVHHCFNGILVTDEVLGVEQ